MAGLRARTRWRLRGRLRASAPAVPVDPPVPPGPSIIEALDARDLLATLSDGDAVASWPSHAGGVAAAQADGVRQPLWRADALGTGMAGVYFDGSNDALLWPLDVETGWTIVMLFTLDADTNDHYLLDSELGRIAISARIPDLGIDKAGIFTGDGTWRSGGADGPTSGTHAYVWTQDEAGLAKVYQEQSEIVSSSTTARKLAGTTVIGSRFSQHYTFFKGAMHAIHIYDGSLDAAKVASAIAQLDSDWGRGA